MCLFSVGPYRFAIGRAAEDATVAGSKGDMTGTWVAPVRLETLFPTAWKLGYVIMKVDLVVRPD